MTDYTPKAVDLSDFSRRPAVPPPPLVAKPEAVQAPAPGGPRPAKAPARRRAKQEAEAAEPTGAKVQFVVHLPAETHQWLRQRAAELGWPKREVILDAFVTHREALTPHASDAERRRAAGLPPRTPPRRREVSGVPSNVYMDRAEAEVLDRHAKELGMSRSQMVTELLVRAAAPPAAPAKRAGARRPRHDA
ncbi:MAG TPA: hypothetical protein VFJ85_01175 [Acidimicrobiales bacterium]|nr:hypothetical protein [Acidimicrobiales bacterium]